MVVIGVGVKTYAASRLQRETGSSKNILSSLAQTVASCTGFLVIETLTDTRKYRWDLRTPKINMDHLPICEYVY